MVEKMEINSVDLLASEVARAYDEHFRNCRLLNVSPTPILQFVHPSFSVAQKRGFTGTWRDWKIKVTQVRAMAQSRAARIRIVEH